MADFLQTVRVDEETGPVFAGAGVVVRRMLWATPSLRFGECG